MVRLERPLLIGVVNVTEDSFSDGGRFLDPGKAVDQALRLFADGADAIELGPASSHPDAREVSAEEEIRRLRPLLEPLQVRGVRLSIDSDRPETQAFALEHGVDFLNDIRGFPVRELWPSLAAAGCRLIVMHSVQRGPATRTRTDAGEVVEAAESFLARRRDELVAAGVARERIVLDPGMGFFLGADPEPSLAMLRALPELRARLAAPLLVSVSRKSFLGAISGRDVVARGAATLAAELFCVEQGVDYVRTHDPGALRDALDVREALLRE